jgi:DNA-binding transcriptional LysR family regulator
LFLDLFLDLLRASTSFFVAAAQTWTAGRARDEPGHDGKRVDHYEGWYYIRAGRLKCLLPQRAVEEDGLFLHYPRRASPAPKLQAFIDAAKAAFARDKDTEADRSALYWPFISTFTPRMGD